MFPDLPGPKDWSSEEQPHVAEAAYWRISGNIGTMMKMDLSGLVQKKVKSTGMVLCHTHVTNDLVLAYYITDDLGCLMEDFDSTHKEKVVKVAKSYGKNIAMAASRLPQHAAELNKGYKRVGVIAQPDVLRLPEIAAVIGPHRAVAAAGDVQPLQRFESYSAAPR